MIRSRMSRWAKSPEEVAQLRTFWEPPPKRERPKKVKVEAGFPFLNHRTLAETDRERLRELRYKGILPPLLALGFALVAATDWGLEAPGQITICAVDRQTCELALEFMREGRLFPELPREGWSCRPHPGCRPEGDLYIKGFNAP